MAAVTMVEKSVDLLFMCSFNACKHNKVSKEIYERVVNKGRSKKLALIAVSNKLLKRAFAIAKSGHLYDDTFVSVLLFK
jgi:transposase